MSMRYKGSVISATPPTVSTATAMGVWTLVQQLQAQGAGTWPAPIPYWIGTLSGSSRGFGIALDSSGNIYVAGNTIDSGSGTQFTLIIKYDSAGTVQWQRTLGVTTSNSLGYNIAVDSSSNVYVVGYTTPLTPSDPNVLITKYNTSGTIQWQRTLGKSLTDVGNNVAVDVSGNVYITGSTTQIGTTYVDIIIAKYNTSGAIQWQRTLTDSSSSIGYSVIVDSSGNVYVGAGTAGGTINGAFIAKYDTSGTIQWQKYYNVNGSTYKGIAVDSSGNVYVAGAGGSLAGLLVSKYNSSGALQWTQKLGTTASALWSSIAIDSSNNIYVTGQSASGTTSDITIAKYDSSGTIQWQRTLGTTSTDIGYGITVDATGSLYVTGTANSTFIIAKLPTNGALTGTYGSFTYAASSFTATTPVNLSFSAGLTDAASTLTDATSTLTSATSSLTSTLTTIP